MKIMIGKMGMKKKKRDRNRLHLNLYPRGYWAKKDRKRNPWEGFAPGVPEPVGWEHDSRVLYTPNNRPYAMCPNPKCNRPNILAAHSVKNCLNLDELYKLTFEVSVRIPYPLV